MNNRQKAKHFKRLYESTLSQTPYPVIHITQPLTHYRSSKTLRNPGPTVEPNPELRSIVIDSAKQSIITDLTPLLRDHITTTADPYDNTTTYTLDIWLKS